MKNKADEWVTYSNKKINRLCCWLVPVGPALLIRRVCKSWQPHATFERIYSPLYMCIEMYVKLEGAAVTIFEFKSFVVYTEMRTHWTPQLGQVSFFLSRNVQFLVSNRTAFKINCIRHGHDFPSSFFSFSWAKHIICRRGGKKTTADAAKRHRNFFFVFPLRFRDLFHSFLLWRFSSYERIIVAIVKTVWVAKVIRYLLRLAEFAALHCRLATTFATQTRSQKKKQNKNYANVRFFFVVFPLVHLIRRIGLHKLSIVVCFPSKQKGIR